MREFINPTDSGFGPEEISKRIREQLAAGNKVGARLLSVRATGSEIHLAQQLLSGSVGVNAVHLTQGGSLSALMGLDSRLHLPTYVERARTVHLAGVKYAPMQAAAWNTTAKKYDLPVSGMEHLAASMRGLLQQGIKEESTVSQARILRKAIRNWSTKQTTFVRSGPLAQAGALPYYLSQQVSITEGPIHQLATDFEQQIGKAIKVARQGGVSLASGLTPFHEGIQKVIASHVALTGAVIGEGFVPSGIKSLRLLGHDPFGAARAQGVDRGRVIVQSIPEWGMGLYYPNVSKSTGFLKSRAALPVQELAQIRGIGGRISPFFSSYFERKAEVAAEAHIRQLGISGAGGRSVLSTPVKVGLLRLKPGLDEATAQRVSGILSRFGDSAFQVSSEMGARISGINRRFSSHVLRGNRATSGYLGTHLHPVIEAALSQAGVGGPINLQTPITYEMLAGSEGLPPGEMFRRTGTVGYNLTERGDLKRVGKGKFSSFQLKRGQQIVQIQPSAGGPIRFQIEDTFRPANQIDASSQILLGPKRLTASGVTPVAISGVDFLGVEGKLGLEAADPNVMLGTAAMRAEELKGAEGLTALGESLGLKVRKRTIKAGDQSKVEYYADTGRKAPPDPGTLATRIEQAESKLGLDKGALGVQWGGMSPEVRAAAFAKATSAEERALLERGVESGVVGTEFSTRGGMADFRGKVGTVRYRMEQLRKYAITVHAAGGADVESMIRDPSDFVKRIYPGADAATIERYSKGIKRHLKVARGIVMHGAPSHRAYLEATFGAMSSELPDLAQKHLQGHVKVVTEEQYRELFGGKGRLNYRSGTGSARDFLGTPFAEEGTTKDTLGRARGSRTTYLVKMSKRGSIPLERQMGTTSVLSDYVVVPAGQVIGVRPEEETTRYLRGRKGMNVKRGFGRLAEDLHNALISGNTDEAFRTSGALSLAGREMAFRKGGWMHQRFSSKLQASITGKFRPAEKLAAGEVEVTVADMAAMLRNKGFKRNAVSELLGKMRTGEQNAFLTVTRHPADQPGDILHMKARLVATKVRNKFGVVDRTGTIGINPGHMPGMHGDFDGDPGSVHLMLGRSKKGLNTQLMQEFYAGEAFHKSRLAEYQATVAVSEAMANKTMMDAGGKKAARSVHSFGALAETAFKMAQAAGANVKTADIDQALKFTQQTLNTALTPIAHVRNEKTNQVLIDILTGKFHAEQINTGADRAKVLQAVEDLQKMWTGAGGRSADVAMITQAGKYTVLKKGSLEAAMTGNWAMEADPQLAAQIYGADLGSSYGTKEAEKAVQRISGPLGKLLDAAPNNPLQTIMMRDNVTREVALDRLVRSLHAAHFVSGNVDNMASAVSGSVFGNTAIPKGGGLLQFADALGVRAGTLNQMVMDAGHAGGLDLIGSAGYEEALKDRSGISQTAKDLMSNGKAIAKKIWASKWGKAAVIGGGAMVGLQTLSNLFGNTGSMPAHASSPAGAPMPPPPMLQDPGADRDMIEMPSDRMAYLQRPMQTRTHYQVEGRDSSGGAAFAGLGDNVFGQMSRPFQNSGSIVDATSSYAVRSEIENGIRHRRRSSF